MHSLQHARMFIVPKRTQTDVQSRMTGQPWAAHMLAAGLSDCQCYCRAGQAGAGGDNITTEVGPGRTPGLGSVNELVRDRGRPALHAGDGRPLFGEPSMDRPARQGGVHGAVKL